MGHHGDKVFGGSCVDVRRISVLFLLYKSTGREFFVPAKTLIGVKLLKKLAHMCITRG